MRSKIYENIVVSTIGCFLIVSCSEPGKNIFSNEGSRSAYESVPEAKTQSNYFTRESYKNISIGDDFNAQLLERNTDIIDDCFNAVSRIEKKDISYQIESSKVAVISTSESGFESYSGVKIGNSLEEVYSKHENEYPEIIDNPYGEPNKNIVVTYWYSPEKDKGIRYDVDDNVVTGMSIGNSSLVFLEGCS